MKDFVVVEDGVRLEGQRVLFVGGKGGVGKTSTASALALRLAERGERCLLVSTDPAHSLSDLFDQPLGDREVLLAPNLWGMEIDPDAQVQRHLHGVQETMRGLVRPELFPEIERQMSLARQSPGAVEAALLERMSELMIHAPDHYDRLIFDTAPTGHTLRLLSLPEIMAAWTDGLLRQRDRSDSWNQAIQRLGPRSTPGEDLAFMDPPIEKEDERSNKIRTLLLERRRKFYQARRSLLDPETTGFILVLVPEKLPILESRKAVEALQEFKVPILALVVNRVLPQQHLGDFLEQRRVQEAAYLSQIDSHFAGLPRVRVPLLPRDIQGVDGLRNLADRLLGAS